MLYSIKADSSHLFAIALFRAIHFNDTTLLEKLQQELIELWNGDGI